MQSCKHIEDPRHQIYEDNHSPLADEELLGEGCIKWLQNNGNMKFYKLFHNLISIVEAG